MPDAAVLPRTAMQQMREHYGAVIAWLLPSGRDRAPPADPRVDTATALIEEFKAILEETELGPAARPMRPRMSEDHARHWNAARTALCLSGGGIRSAAFSLGVLQSLARAGLLLDFHYLSTVSGGGYTGAWLAAVMKHGGGRAAAQEALTKPGDSRLEGLRDFTNFLTPSPGLASADTRAAVVLWLRNVLLNWLVFGPAMLAIALVPTLYVAFLAVGAQTVVAAAAGGVGLCLLLIATYNACCNIPAHRYRQPPESAGSTSRTVQMGIVAPALSWALLAPVASIAAAQPLALGFVGPQPPWHPGDLWLTGGAFAALLMGYFIAWLSLGHERRRGFGWNLPWWTAASLAAAGLLQLGAWLGRSLPLEWFAVLGPLWVIGVHVLQSTVYVGLRWVRQYADLDREWLARLNSDKLAPALVWSALAATTLLLPFYLGHVTVPKLVALASGPAGAWLASSTKSLFGRKTPPGSGLSWLMPALIETAIGLATLAFAVVLLMLLAEAGRGLAPVIAHVLHLSTTQALLALTVFATAAALALGRRVNVNRFSLHGVYRNRLVRAFLGTARPNGRLPDAYTKFDPSDNLRVKDLYVGAARRGRLFPVINTTLNLTVSKRTAWSERKAAPFTVTPLRAGADCLHRANAEGEPEDPPGVFVRTDTYGGGEPDDQAAKSVEGFTLGGAMTTSGAAVSPNMGYHTRPAIAFLMTLFDVRLGAWMPNPAKTGDPKWLNRGRPNNALFALGAEMLGRAGDQRDNVYLSDGGHFDNLGLYEMLRRECRNIVVVDASEDFGYAYADLGDSVRRAAIDHGATITFAPALCPQSRTLPLRGAYAHITYRSGAEGDLIYLKPWLPSDMPADVMAYHAGHQTFPHESTADQFFTESQFESYRHLGSFIGTVACGQARTLGDWFAAARSQQAAAACSPQTAAARPQQTENPAR